MPDSDPIIHSRETRQLLDALKDKVELRFQHTSEALTRLERSSEERAAEQKSFLDNIKIEGQEREARQTEKIEEIKSILKWAGGLIVSLILTVLGWSAVQQFEANQARQDELQQQIELLEQREELQRLNTGGPQTPDTTLTLPK